MASKRVPFRVVKETLPNGSEIELKYLDTMTDAARAGGLQGMTVGDMVDKQELVRALQDAGKAKAEYIDLTPPLHKKLLDAVRSFRFRVFLFSAVEMVEAIQYAPDTPEDDE